MNASPLSSLFTEDIYVVPPVLTVVVPASWDKLSENDKGLLSKILGSVKISLASVRIVTIGDVTIDTLRALGSERILIFGCPAPFESYQLVQAQGFSLIRADELAALDDTKKKNLWIALKKMFGL